MQPDKSTIVQLFDNREQYLIGSIGGHGGKPLRTSAPISKTCPDCGGSGRVEH
jgi:hypothetical protein